MCDSTGLKIVATDILERRASEGNQTSNEQRAMNHEPLPLYSAPRMGNFPMQYVGSGGGHVDRSISGGMDNTVFYVNFIGRKKMDLVM